MTDDQQAPRGPTTRPSPYAPRERPPSAPPDPAAPAPAPAASEAHTTDPVARRGFRERLGRLRRTEGGDRSYGLAALIASALAGIIVGGLGLTAVHAITHDGPGDRGGWVERRDAGGPGGRFGGPGGMDGGPPGMPGQVQPTTPPEDDSDG